MREDQTGLSRQESDGNSENMSFHLWWAEKHLDLWNVDADGITTVDLKICFHSFQQEQELPQLEKRDKGYKNLWSRLTFQV